MLEAGGSDSSTLDKAHWKEIMRKSAGVGIVVLCLMALAGVIGLSGRSGGGVMPDCGAGAGNVKDEAMCVGRTVESLPAADDDYFADMDNGATRDHAAVARDLAPWLSNSMSAEDAWKAVVVGRNNWIVWTAGDDRLWDIMNSASFGELDFLKILSSHPSQKDKFDRSRRWRYFGLLNEPCFTQPTKPREDRFKLWLDERDPDCRPDPFENETKYKGVEIGARGRRANFPAGSLYGYATGVVGLRLFPNPKFDEEAEKKWDAERFYIDESYYNDKNLIRPYRVGMSCGFCHVGPNPTNPPADPENPKWENLNSNPGAQYFWWDRIFSFASHDNDFAVHYLRQSRPGALDTSLLSTDYIANPRTMNAVYSLGARLEIARRFGAERLTGGERDNKQFNDDLPAGTPLTKFFVPPDKVWTPRILKDGADSIGALGSLNRVYVNIGMFSEEWLEHFNPIVGGKPISPITIKNGRKNSSYWQATESQTPDVALFLLATAKPDLLKDAPGGSAFLTEDADTVNRGKAVFGERCARCHSSKLPEKAFSFFPGDGCVGPNYLQCWNNYWNWTKTDEFKQAIVPIVADAHFLDGNFLSTDLRVPVTLLETNACSPLATNAIRDNVWNDFSSTSYKDLPAVGAITVHDPVTGAPRPYEMPGGGRGYTRVPSLISLWSTAPFLLNNSVGEPMGRESPRPSVENRMHAFDVAIEQMLWPEKRNGNINYVTASGKMLPGWIDRTTAESWLMVPKGYLPGLWPGAFDTLVRHDPLIAWLRFQNFVDDEGVAIGPIPKGTPVALLGNLDLDARPAFFADVAYKFRLARLLLKLKSDLQALPKGGDENARNAAGLSIFSNAVGDLLAVNKCPDFIVNRGHYFGTEYLKEEPGLGDADKKALIAFLKTF
jgi:hypothetical protein